MVRMGGEEGWRDAGGSVSMCRPAVEEGRLRFSSWREG